MEGMGARHGAKPTGTGFGGARLGLPVHGDQAKGRFVPPHPLKVVKGRPKDVPGTCSKSQLSL